MYTNTHSTHGTAMTRVLMVIVLLMVAILLSWMIGPADGADDSAYESHDD